MKNKKKKRKIIYRVQRDIERGESIGATLCVFRRASNPLPMPSFSIGKNNLTPPKPGTHTTCSATSKRIPSRGARRAACSYNRHDSRSLPLFLRKLSRSRRSFLLARQKVPGDIRVVTSTTTVLFHFGLYNFVSGETLIGM